MFLCRRLHQGLPSRHNRQFRSETRARLLFVYCDKLDMCKHIKHFVLIGSLVVFLKCYISSGHGWWWSFTYSSVLLSKLKCLLWKNEVVFSPRMVGLSGLNRQVEPAIYGSLYLEFPIFQTKLKSKVIELILHCSLTKNWWNCKVDELDVSRIWTLHHVQLFDLISVTTSACPKTKK